MDYLHTEFNLGPGDILEVTLDHAANVQLMDTVNFTDYRNGRPFRYIGGFVQKSPYRLKAPRAGKWHLVIDLGGNAGAVRASTRVLPATFAMAQPR